MLKQSDPTLPKTTPAEITSLFGQTKLILMVEATLDWLKSPSPKLVPAEDRLAVGGGMI